LLEEFFSHDVSHSMGTNTQPATTESTAILGLRILNKVKCIRILIHYKIKNPIFLSNSNEIIAGLIVERIEINPRV